MEERGAENVFDFSLGNPDLPTPEPVQKALQEIAAKDWDHGYMANAGYEKTRASVAKLESKRNDVAFDASGIVMTCGAAAALNITLASLLDPEDEVIILSPYFPEYLSYVRNYAAQSIIVPCLASGQMDLAQIEKALSAKTKAIIINSPNNPSGAVYPKEDLEQLAEILKQAEQTIYIVSDEPYRELVYTAEPVPGIAGIYPNSLICYSWSKSFSLPGERIGYVAVPNGAADYDDLMAALVLQNRVHGFVNAPAIWQKVVTETMDLEVDPSPYQRRRDALLENFELAGLGIKDIPEGAFYLFPELPEKTKEAGEFALEVFKEQGILGVNGTGFGAPGSCVCLLRSDRSLKIHAKDLRG